MKPIDADAVRIAWERAAADLGIEVVTEEVPGTIAIVHGFGRPSGTALIPPDTSTDARRVLEQGGYLVSAVSDSYERYDRELFTDALEVTLRHWDRPSIGRASNRRSAQPRHAS